MRIKLTLEYDGTGYSGWQRQSGQDSIQARIEAGLEKIFSDKVRISVAGRTDAGVHALGQVASFNLPRRFEASELRRALNALLPPDIVVREACEVPDSFDPRRDALSRAYEYRILNQASPSVFEYRYSWLVRDALNLEAMNGAARLFLGEHDFAAFRTLGTEVKTTVRCVHSSQWSREHSIVKYRVEGSGFLRHMVRAMVAAMVEIGRGRLGPGSVARLLEGRDRALTPAAAPACGLFLVAVRYRV